ncbi:MAG TPA: thioesterase family protein [Acidimicrobiia bacterium]|jgi:acyl-CoA thioesterase|nr:thioesterase family protein [Acidimicrobiia bacterium]
MTYTFDTDTVSAVGDGGVTSVDLTDRWNALGGAPNGGYLAALSTRALSDELAFPDPVVVATTFVRPARLGPATVTTTELRIGSRFAHGTATVIQDDVPVVHTTATFGDLDRLSGKSRVSLTPPDLPAPEDCIDITGMLDMPGVSIIDRVEYRLAALPGWATGQPSGEPRAEFWMRFSDGREPDTSSLPFLVDAAAPAVLELGVKGSSTIQLTTHVRAKPTPGWLTCRVATRCLIDGIHEEDFEVWDWSGQLVAQARQLAIIPAG